MEPELCSGLDVRSDADVDASHISEDTVPGDALASKLSGAIGRAVCVAMAESNNGNETCRRTTGVLVARAPRILLPCHWSAAERNYVPECCCGGACLVHVAVKM